MADLLNYESGIERARIVQARRNATWRKVLKGLVILAVIALVLLIAFMILVHHIIATMPT